MAPRNVINAFSKVITGASNEKRSGQAQAAKELSLQAPVGARTNPPSFSSFLAGEYLSQVESKRARSCSRPYVRLRPAEGSNPNASRSSQRILLSHVITQASCSRTCTQMSYSSATCAFPDAAVPAAHHRAVAVGPEGRCCSPRR